MTTSVLHDTYKEEGSTLSFEEVFGADKATIKSLATTHLYTNPSNNQWPVTNPNTWVITWMDLNGDSPTTATKYIIDSEWGASGLLIIDGHRNTSTQDIEALQISGKWNFNGVVWVIGKVKITGTPTITGSVFAESAVDVESKLGGNATLNYIAGNVQGALGLLTGSSSTIKVSSWQEL